MQDDITIRPAVAEDAEIIHAALKTMAVDMGAEAKFVSTVEDVRRHGFGETPAFEVLIAEAGAAFAGLCLSFPSFSTWMGEPGLYVQDLFVADAFRGRRIAERLLRATAQRGRTRGAHYMRLSVDVDNLRAQGLYDRLGIRHSRSEQIHMIKGADFDAFAEGEP
ncbi:GNAT family N-acetyltransferase [Shinella granuli]|uniref:Acetyltransferase (GNAT) family protein n=1 Tax=Shinella granuli TaxID=323621 RepID=A0A4R2CFE7_SHIGR|nr:GNAT family N-acetyltransferase [Shinella granuli]TCN37834.1 acetyltransferase (GNAT) family protein [Shinella granuli]